MRSTGMADFAATAYPAQCAVVVAWNEVAAADPAHPRFIVTERGVIHPNFVP